MFLTSLTWSAAATSRKLQSKSFAKMSPTMIIIGFNNEEAHMYVLAADLLLKTLVSGGPCHLCFLIKPGARLCFDCF